MTKTSSLILTGLIIASFFFSEVSGVIAKEKTYKGKVIDFNTKKPLERATVVATWFNLKDDPFIKDVKEALTDKNGEWSIVGEEGDRLRPHPLPSFSQRIFNDTLEPQFMIFKPGYEDFRVSTGLSYGFLAYPHLDKNRRSEGIILSVDAKEERYMRKLSGGSHSEAPKTYGLPFIPMKDPERRLRNLEIPFDYRDNIERLYVDTRDSDWLAALEGFVKINVEGDKNLRTYVETLQREAPHFFANLFHFTGFLNNYTLFGLRQLGNKQHRRAVLTRVRPVFSYSDDPIRQRDLLKKQKHLLRLFEEECKNLGMDDYKEFRKILEY